MAFPSMLCRLTAPKRMEPSYPSLPEIDESTCETNVAGIYAVDELARTPLVKLGLNAGKENHLTASL